MAFTSRREPPISVFDPVAAKLERMLIIPLDKAIDWKRPPVVTLLLILVNVFVYLVVQSGDDRRVEEALNFYLESVLPDIELPLYIDSGTPDVAESWELMHETGLDDEAQLYLLMQMQSDERFMQRLRDGDLVSSQHPEYEAWLSDRAQFEKLLDSTTSATHGFTPSSAEPAAFLTYMFLHGSLEHLIGNMIFLLVVGLAVELALGWRTYLGFYLGCGLAAVTLYWAVYSTSDMPLVGASGAIAGLMGLYAVLFGARRIRFFYWIVVYFDYVKAPAIILFPLWVANELVQLTWGGASSVALCRPHRWSAVRRIAGRGLSAAGLDKWILIIWMHHNALRPALPSSRMYAGCLAVSRLTGPGRRSRCFPRSIHSTGKFSCKCIGSRSSILRLRGFIVRRCSCLPPPVTIEMPSARFTSCFSTIWRQLSAYPPAADVTGGARDSIHQRRVPENQHLDRHKATGASIEHPGPGADADRYREDVSSRNDHAMHRHYLKLLIEHFPAGDAAKAARTTLDGHAA